MNNINLEQNIQDLVDISQFYGQKNDFVLAGGGNTSFKTTDTLYVKGSGVALADIDRSGFVAMNRALLQDLLNADLGKDSQKREELFKNAIMSARYHPELNQRPSVECVLHNLLNSQFVVHTHSTVVNTVSCGVNGQQRCTELFGDSVIWIDYVDPGYTLAKVVYDKVVKYQDKFKKHYPAAIIMENHGLIVCGDTIAEIKKNTSQIIEKIAALYQNCDESQIFGEIVVKDLSERRLFPD